MNRLINNIRFWILLSVLLLLPFLLLSFFCHPSADDFIVSAFIRERGIIGHMSQIYHQWSGRYFSSIVNCFNPLVFGWLWGYKLIPIIMILLFYFSIKYFLGSIFSSSFSKLSLHLFTLIIVLLYFNDIPSTSECIYWMDGSLIYLFGNAMLLLFFGSIIKLFHDPKLKKVMMVSLLVLPVIIIGSNEISMIAIDEIIFLILFFLIVQSKKIPRILYFILLIAIVSTVTEMTAPGNYDKMVYFPDNMNFIFSMQQSVMAFFKISMKFIIDPAFILTTVLFASLLPGFYKNKIFKNLISFSPFITLPVSLLILLSLYFFVLFATGLNPALRIHNAVGLFFVFACFYNIAVLHNFLIRRFKTELLEVPSFLIKLMAAATFIFILTQFGKEPGKEIVFEGNVIRAYYDLFYKAHNYDRELSERESNIRLAVERNEKQLTVKPLSGIPETIHFMDITDNPWFWVNVCEAKYFGLDSLKTYTLPKDTVN